MKAANPTMMALTGLARALPNAPVSMMHGAFTEVSDINSLSMTLLVQQDITGQRARNALIRRVNLHLCTLWLRYRFPRRIRDDVLACALFPEVSLVITTRLMRLNYMVDQQS